MEVFETGRATPYHAARPRPARGQGRGRAGPRGAGGAWLTPARGGGGTPACALRVAAGPGKGPRGAGAPTPALGVASTFALHYIIIQVSPRILDDTGRVRMGRGGVTGVLLPMTSGAGRRPRRATRGPDQGVGAGAAEGPGTLGRAAARERRPARRRSHGSRREHAGDRGDASSAREWPRRSAAARQPPSPALPQALAGHGQRLPELRACCVRLLARAGGGNWTTGVPGKNMTAHHLHSCWSQALMR